MCDFDAAEEDFLLDEMDGFGDESEVERASAEREFFERDCPPPDEALPEDPSEDLDPAFRTPTRKDSVVLPTDGSAEKREAPGGKSGQDRKRLRGKQSVTSSFASPLCAPSSALLVIDGKPIHEHVAYKKYNKLPAATRRLASKRLSQQKYRAVQELMKNGTAELLGETIKFSGEQAEALKFVEDKLFRAIATDETRSMADRGYAMRQMEIRRTSAEAMDMFSAGDAPTIFNVPSVLLTYIGDVGVIDVSSVKLPFSTLSEPSSSEPSVADKFKVMRAMDIDDLAVILSTHLKVVGFFNELVDVAVSAVNRLRTPHWAVGVEICGKTLATSDVLRIHGHVWITLKNQKLALSSMAVDGGRCVPFANWKAVQFLAGVSTRAANSGMSGALYCTIAKKGSIKRQATLEPWVDFAVKDTWITSLFSGSKITHEVARQSFLRCVHRATYNVANVDFCAKERFTDELLQRMNAAEALIRATFKPWRVIPDVERWRAQYLQVLARYFFLVLDGDSCFGKTKYAYGLNDIGQTFYCDCTGGIPDMRKFRSEKFKAILLDELSPQAAIRCKKMLQASNELVTMGVSPTMVASYCIHLWRTQVIVCSNVWASGLKKMKKKDRDWLVKNAIYIRVSEPMWVED